jgi:hypothetical protein
MNARLRSVRERKQEGLNHESSTQAATTTGLLLGLVACGSNIDAPSTDVPSTGGPSAGTSTPADYSPWDPEGDEYEYPYSDWYNNDPWWQQILPSDTFGIPPNPFPDKYCDRYCTNYCQTAPEDEKSSCYIACYRQCTLI